MVTLSLYRVGVDQRIILKHTERGIIHKVVLSANDAEKNPLLWYLWDWYQLVTIYTQSKEKKIQIKANNEKTKSI